MQEEQPTQGAVPTAEEVAIVTRKRSQLLPVLRIREFMVFSVSQAVSLFGDKLDYMALLAMIAYFAREFQWESARAISFLSVVVALPTILFGPLAGILVDRWDRRKVMIICDSARTLLVLAVPVLAIATRSLPLIFALAFCVFLFGLFFNTSRLSIIPNLVGKDRVLGANSFMNLIGRVATLLGMFLGGLIVDWSGWLRLGIKPVWSAGFYIDSLTYFVSVIALLIVFKRLSGTWHPRTGRLTVGDEARMFINQQSKMLHEVKELWRLVSREPSVLFVNCSVLGYVILGAAVLVLYIPIIQSGRDLGGVGLGTKGVGYVAAIGSVGLVLSSMAYGFLGHRFRKHKVMLFSFLLLGLVTMALAMLKQFLFVVPLALVAGLALSPVNIGMDTLIHESVPEQARGRIFSTREWILSLFFAISAFVIGQLTNFFAVRHLLFGVGALIAIASMVGFLATRGSRIG